MILLLDIKVVASLSPAFFILPVTLYFLPFSLYCPFVKGEGIYFCGGHTHRTILFTFSDVI
jgi:hypothetical protein